jgi:CDGSH-type Zn-finger protein
MPFCDSTHRKIDFKAHPPGQPVVPDPPEQK